MTTAVASLASDGRDDTVLLHRDGPVGLVTINRPRMRNALDIATVRRLSAVVTEAQGDETLRVLVLTGAGDIAFSAGGDMREMTRQSVLESDESMQAWQDALGRIERGTKPVIAAVNGYAFGGGTEIAMACHIRVCSEDSRFGQTEIRHDHLPGAGGTQRLPRLIPLSAAYELLLTGDDFSAADALRLGLVSRVFPKTELLDGAMALARRIAARAPLVVRYTMEAVRDGLAVGSLDAGLRLERALAALVMASPEAQDGLARFVRREEP